MKLIRKKVIEAIEGTYGNKMMVSKKCGCTWEALWYFLKKHPDIEERIQKERNKIVYLAENKLLQIITQGDIKDKPTIDAVLKVLNSRIAQNHDWLEKQIIENKNLNVNIDIPQEQIDKKIVEIISNIRDGTGK